LTLRPEATASVMRAYIEHRLDQIPGIKKLYYIGPMFRRERPQKGRFRQFYQIGAEAIGSDSPVVDAEVIEMVVELLRRAGMEGFNLLLNSVGCADCRPAYLALLRERLAGMVSNLCADCQRRAVTNPLRVLDCKVPSAKIWMRAGSPTRCVPAWCAAWTTTCAPRSRSPTERWVPRTRCWAAAGTTGSPKR
jgi:histidyl-tRNA synthetase